MTNGVIGDPNPERDRRTARYVAWVAVLGVVVGAVLGGGASYLTARLTVSNQQANDRRDALRAEKLSVWGAFSGQIVTTQQAIYDTSVESSGQAGKHPADVATINSLMSKADQQIDGLCAATGRLSIIGPSEVSSLSDRICSQLLAAGDAMQKMVDSDLNDPSHAAADAAFDRAFGPVDKTRADLLAAMGRNLG